jgi:hypothetical protein
MAAEPKRDWTDIEPMEYWEGRAQGNERLRTSDGAWWERDPICGHRIEVRAEPLSSWVRCIKLPGHSGKHSSGISSLLRENSK